ncbi:hypothetical protein Fot_30082 [Forsythia ovata]|uniref:Uncharacterized protein n=1 Tax=Forsythia ovata TaxID=205694 RepID=A0ABD1TTR1_9LAMI
MFRAWLQERKLFWMYSWNSCSTPESRDNTEVLDDPQLRVCCTLYTSPEKREQEYVRLFVSDPRREDPILDSYFDEDRGDGAVRDEEPVDVFEDVRKDHHVGASRGPYSSPAVAPRIPPRMSRPCCKHRNMLRQILQQMNKLTGTVDELNWKVDRS